ncbi:MAG: transporter substrate-binding domain-containing protein [Clostridia bacterium]|nr:transporter substrate-binding domain-containing protein [Clostridia bacterium]
MKKFTSIILALVMMLSCVAAFASCQKPDENNDLNFGKELLSVDSQLNALNGLVKGDADIAVIDSVMAGYYMNGVDTFKNYQVLPGVILAEEQYGIAAKKGNAALIGKINEAMIALADTEYKNVANKYGLATETLVKADTANPNAAATDASWNKIVEAKKLIIGYTLFAPIAYNEGDGADAKFVGFDIDLAKAVVEYLNTKYSAEIQIEFVEIEWAQKETLLENGSIDLVWNGMTITEERLAAMEISVPYLANKQVAIVKKADAAKYGANKEEFMKKTDDAIIIVEKGSAGEELVKPVE